MIKPLQVFVVVICILLCQLPCYSTVIYVSQSGDDVNDGLSWAAAKKSVQAAVSAASEGNEIWVAAGTYQGQIQSDIGLSFYGGFSGTETELTKRDWKANVTVLDGANAGTVIYIYSGTTTPSRIDGFTITNGKAPFGAGIACGDSITITNNVITGNIADDLGGGILLGTQEAFIINNDITHNTAGSRGAGIYIIGGNTHIHKNNISFNGYDSYQYSAVGYGGGIFCAPNASPIISNNDITCNSIQGSGGGIFCASQTAKITGNRIIGNKAYGDVYNNRTGLGGGISIDARSEAVIASNIIACNSALVGGAGISCRTASPVIVNNTIAGNISSGSAAGIYLIYNSDPTITNNIVAYNTSGIGIGDESSVPVLTNNCVYDNNSLDYIGIEPGSGDISENPIFAGFELGDFHIQPNSPCIDAGDLDSVQPDWTDIDGEARVQGTCVDIGADESDGNTHIITPKIVYVDDSAPIGGDGSGWEQAFRSIQRGIDELSGIGGEVWIAEGEYPEKISLTPFIKLYGGFCGSEDNREDRDWKKYRAIVGFSDADYSIVCTQFSTLDGLTVKGGLYGIFAEYCSPVIANNTVINAAYGISVSHGSPEINNNRIARCLSGGILCYEGSPVVTRNLVLGADTAIVVSGRFNEPNPEDEAIISGNILAGNQIGVDCSYIDAHITNNTIVECGYYGIISGYGTITAANNIIAFNNIGVRSGYYEDQPITLLHNNLYGNRTDYERTDPGETDISVDPEFIDYDFGDLHISPDSPCRDAGCNWVSGIIEFDMDGQPRLQDMTVDIGADESDGSIIEPVRRRIYVNENAQPGGDGSSWQEAYQTITDGAIDTELNGGAEIWAAKGLYIGEPAVWPMPVMAGGIRMVPFSHLYGGFNGSETEAYQRDIIKNETVIQGPESEYLSVAVSAASISTIDGFTITGGDFGVFCDSDSPTIKHNIIVGNVSGVTCRSGRPLIENNFITNNSKNGVLGDFLTEGAILQGNIIADNGINGAVIYGDTVVLTNNLIKGNIQAGVRCEFSSPSITNNTFIENGTGILMHRRCSPIIMNNIIAYGETGVLVDNTDTYLPPPEPILSHNDVFGNIVSYSNIEPGSGDFSLDPLFVNPFMGDYHLHPDSPCINCGLNDTPYMSQFDLDGNPRIRMGTVDIGAYEYQPMDVCIDIKPGEYPNSINPKSKGLTPVAVLSSDVFDVGMLNQPSVRLSRAAPVKTGVLADVNKDGLKDLLLHFDTSSIAISFGDTSLTLIGRTINGEWVEGSDNIKIVGSK